MMAWTSGGRAWESVRWRGASSGVTGGGEVGEALDDGGGEKVTAEWEKTCPFLRMELGGEGGGPGSGDSMMSGGCSTKDLALYLLLAPRDGRLLRSARCRVFRSSCCWRFGTSGRSAPSFR